MKQINLLKQHLVKFKEWWKDEVVWYWRNKIKHPIVNFIIGLKRWFSYYKVCQNIYDFDYTGILEVERHQIERTRDSIIYFHNHEYWKRDVERMNLTLKLLSIAMGEDSISELISGSHWTEKIEGEDLWEWKSDAKYEATKYVNIRNAHRFSKIPKEYYIDSDIKGLNLDHLRVEKAWYLYNKLKYYWERSFWD